MKRLLAFSVFCCAMAIAPFAHSQTTAVAPADFANEEGNSGGEGTSLGSFSNSAQVVYNESTLSGLNIGDQITGMSFRLNGAGNSGTLRQAPVWSVDEYIISIGSSLNSAGDLAANFADNRGSDFIFGVHTGPVTLDGTEFDTSSTAENTGSNSDNFQNGTNTNLIPNEFGFEFVFDTPYTYMGGDLLLEYTHSFIDSANDNVPFNSDGSPNPDFNPALPTQIRGTADAVIGFAGVQSSFSPGFNTTDGLGFGGFGNEFAAVVQFTVESVADGDTVQPVALDVFREITNSGALAEVLDSDDSRLQMNPGFTIGAFEAPVWLIFDAALAGDAPSSLVFDRESSAGTPGLTVTTEAFNWNTNAFDVVDATNEVFMNDTVVSVDLSGDVSDFVEPGTGNVRSRVGWRQTGFTINFPWEARIDQISWTFAN